MNIWKKLLPLLLVLCLALGLAACTADDALQAAQTAAEIADALAEADVAQPSEETPLPPDFSLPEETDGVGPAAEPETPADMDGDGAAPDPDGWYTSKEDVALYLYLYGVLPGNFITKSEARELGWSGGGLDDYAPGKSIGGDRFGNYEGLLPDGDYHECDIDTMHAASRGAKRLVYSSDGRIYYTDDHYESFTLLYGEE